MRARGTDVLPTLRGAIPSGPYQAPLQWALAGAAPKDPHPPGASARRRGRCASDDQVTDLHPRPAPVAAPLLLHGALTTHMRAPQLSELSGSVLNESNRPTLKTCAPAASGAVVPAAQHDAFCGIRRLPQRAELRV